MPSGNSGTSIEATVIATSDDPLTSSVTLPSGVKATA